MMAFSLLQGSVASTSTSSNNENADFYKGSEGYDEGNGLEDLLVKSNGNSEEEKY